MGMYRQGGGRVRHGRSRGGRVRDEEEARQKFSVMSMEEGTGGRWCRRKAFLRAAEGWVEGSQDVLLSI